MPFVLSQAQGFGGVRCLAHPLGTGFQNPAITGLLVELCKGGIKLSRSCRRCWFMLHWSKMETKKSNLDPQQFPLTALISLEFLWFCRFASRPHSPDGRQFREYLESLRSTELCNCLQVSETAWQQRQLNFFHLQLPSVCWVWPLLSLCLNNYTWLWNIEQC